MMMQSILTDCLETPSSFFNYAQSCTEWMWARILVPVCKKNGCLFFPFTLACPSILEVVSFCFYLKEAWHSWKVSKKKSKYCYSNNLLAADWPPFIPKLSTIAFLNYWKSPTRSKLIDFFHWRESSEVYRTPGPKVESYTARCNFLSPLCLWRIRSVCSDRSKAWIIFPAPNKT